MTYVGLFFLVFGLNLLPAFAPPTWSIVVLYGLNGQLPLWALVVTAAVAASLGRFALAWGCRIFAARLPQHLRDNLDAARIALHRRSHNVILALGLFLLSPLPSAQLFMAVGLARVPLLGFTAAFFVGRLVTYSLYGWTARKIQQSSIGDAFMETLSSPWGILLQVTMLAALIALVRVDWARLLGVTPAEVEAARKGS
jgi:membrane protein DedA with SNARE-associated domain